jgi:hypothetical protein
MKIDEHCTCLTGHSVVSLLFFLKFNDMGVGQNLHILPYFFLGERKDTRVLTPICFLKTLALSNCPTLAP